MCGRYTLHLADLRQLKALLRVQRVLISDFRARYNVAPTQDAPVVIAGSDRTLESLRWGLVPHWAESASGAARNINARVETVAEKPTFREAFRRGRCIVPATGFFEWQKQSARGRAQPIWVHPREPGVVAFAGVFDCWRTPSGERLRSFAIVTTDAKGALQEVHPRMPLELRGDAIETWLRPAPLSADELRAIVESTRSEHLELRAVAAGVNSPLLDDASCIEPASTHASEASTQLDLFNLE